MARRKMSDAEILAQIPAARAREAQERRAGLRAISANYDRAARRVILELTNGFSFAFPVRAIRALRRATSAQLGNVAIDPSGSALRWEELDVDLSVPGLLFSAMGPGEPRRHLARLAGSSKSFAKARAARTNGAKGGRPRIADAAAKRPGIAKAKRRSL